jgi:hypothetical protein
MLKVRVGNMFPEQALLCPHRFLYRSPFRKTYFIYVHRYLEHPPFRYTYLPMFFNYEIAMNKAYVQFLDSSESAVVAIFGCAQDADAYPHQGVVDENDSRYLAFINPEVDDHLPGPVEKLMAFLAANPDVAEILK